MANKKAGRQPQRRRKRGRPFASEESGGRPAIIAAARKLLETLPPHRVTIVMIARQAGVDPAMVRYYFASREELFLGVAENLVETWMASHLRPAAPPAEQLASEIAGMVDFARSARSMQRLMIDECAGSKNPEVRKRIQELNERAVRGYARHFDPNQPEPLDPVDPLLLYIAVIGMSEFFAAAQPMIAPLLPPRTSADELAERYKKFLIKLVLDGLRPRR